MDGTIGGVRDERSGSEIAGILGTTTGACSRGKRREPVDAQSASWIHVSTMLVFLIAPAASAGFLYLPIPDGTGSLHRAVTSN